MAIFNFKTKTQTQGTNQETELKQTPEEVLRAKAPGFMSCMDEIEETRIKIRSKTAAMEALFIRTFGRYNNVRDYLTTLKNGKFGDVYEAFGVDLNSNEIDSIDSFCRAMIKDPKEWARLYEPLEVLKVVYKKDEQTKKPEPEKEQEQATDDADEEVVDPIEELQPKEEAGQETEVIPMDQIFDHLIIKEDETNGREEIQFEAGNGKPEGKASGEGSKAADAGSDSGSGKGSGGSGNSRPDNAPSSGRSLSEERRIAKAEIDRVANTIKKYVRKGSEISVEKSVYADGRNIGTYDVTITDESGTRMYVLDKGSIIPDKLSILAITKDNFAIAIPVVKREKDLISKVFSSLYVLTDEEFDRISKSGNYLPDMTLYNNIDFTGASFINNLTDKQKAEFAKNLRFVIEAIQMDSGRSLRFRIQQFNNPEDFVVSSDKDCVSPVPGLFTSSDIGFIKAIYKKNQDLVIAKSDDRIEEEKKAVKSVTADSTITSPMPQMEVKDHRQTA